MMGYRSNNIKVNYNINIKIPQKIQLDAIKDLKSIQNLVIIVLKSNFVGALERARLVSRNGA